MLLYIIVFIVITYANYIATEYNYRQDLILGKFKNEAGVVYDYYYEDGELYYKLETQSQWKRKKYDTDKQERPVGIQRDAISYFRTIKDQFTITEDKETITIHYQNSDIDFFMENKLIVFLSFIVLK